MSGSGRNIPCEDALLLLSKSVPLPCDLAEWIIAVSQGKTKANKKDKQDMRTYGRFFGLAVYDNQRAIKSIYDRKAYMRTQLQAAMENALWTYGLRYASEIPIEKIRVVRKFPVMMAASTLVEIPDADEAARVTFEFVAAPEGKEEELYEYVHYEKMKIEKCLFIALASGKEQETKFVNNLPEHCFSAYVHDSKNSNEPPLLRFIKTGV